MKGIILAGGMGTRLFPVTKVISKHLLPVYDKPMIYYPLSTLMLAGIHEILVISTPRDLPMYRALLGDGSALGIKLAYAEQAAPRGLPEALTIGSSFVGKDDVILILADNLFYGQGLGPRIREAAEKNEGATVFAYYVRDPERYGVVDLDQKMRPIKLEEKPKNPQSNLAVTGLYIYKNEALRMAAKLKPSARGELEITDLNREFLSKGKLKVVVLGRGIAWLDTGTHRSLLEASSFIATVENRQGLRIACLEEVAFRMGFISRTQLEGLAATGDHDLRQYLARVAAERGFEGAKN